MLFEQQERLPNLPSRPFRFSGGGPVRQALAHTSTAWKLTARSDPSHAHSRRGPKQPLFWPLKPTSLSSLPLGRILVIGLFFTTTVDQAYVDNPRTKEKELCNECLSGVDFGPRCISGMISRRAGGQYELFKTKQLQILLQDEAVREVRIRCIRGAIDLPFRSLSLHGIRFRGGEVRVPPSRPC